MPKLLVIDDEPGIHFSIRRVFAQDAIQVMGARIGRRRLALGQ